MKNKKAALELSIGTIVIIVIGMTMLILGMVLVKNIFFGATESVNILNDKVKASIVNLFGDENKEVIIMLGQDKTAKIKAGSDVFGVAIGAKTLDGSLTSRSRLKYKLSLDDSTSENCADDKFLGESNTKKLFKQKMNEYIEFDEYSGDSSFAIVQIGVPKGTKLCTQKVRIDVKDTQATTGSDNVGGSFFIIDIKRSLF